MKTKLKFATFVATFTFALVLVTSASNISIAQFFKNKKDLQSTVKVYNFLLKEKKLESEWFEKSIVSKQSERKELLKEWNEAKLTLDTSDLPEDFRQAWEKRNWSEVKLCRMIYDDGVIKAEEGSKEKIEERILFDQKLKSVAQDYGIELGEFGTLIEKNK